MTADDKPALLDWRGPAAVGAGTGLSMGIFSFVVMQSRVEAPEAAWGAVAVMAMVGPINWLFARGAFRRAHRREHVGKDHAD